MAPLLPLGIDGCHRFLRRVWDLGVADRSSGGSRDETVDRAIHMTIRKVTGDLQQYAFNTAIETPFWRHCRAHTDLAGAAPIVEYYRENGPTPLWQPTLMDAFDPFGVGGYAALLLGQKVPFHRVVEPSEVERRLWAQRRRDWEDAARRAMTVQEALAVVRSPNWKWLAPTHAG